MLGLLNQDPPLVDHDHEHDHSAWLSGRGLDVTGEACGTQSCEHIYLNSLLLPLNLSAILQNTRASICPEIK